MAPPRIGPLGLAKTPLAAKEFVRKGETKMSLLERIIAGEESEIKDIKGFEYKELAHRIICQDGTEVSVQASRTHYCTPRLNQGPYSTVEVGYPTQDPPIEWAKYADGEYPSDVYGYVPIDLVRQFINSHGGEVEEAV